MDRRTFIKRGLVSVAAAGAGYWAAGVIGDRTVPARPFTLPTPRAPTWSRLSRLVDGRRRGAYPVHSILLPSGDVLMIGGAADTFFEFLFDPSNSHSIITVESLPLPLKEPSDYLECAGHAYLADGRLLLAGGSRSKGGEKGLNYSLLFDPAGERWTRINHDMAGGARWYPAVTRLADSRLLITSGFFDFGENVNRSVEVFDPLAVDSKANPWTELISDGDNEWKIEPTGEDYTHVFLLRRPVRVQGHRREVALVGKTGVVHLLNYTDSFTDPNDRFAVRPNGRRPGPDLEMLADAASSVLLSDGRIMVVGGSSDTTVQQRADIYDPGEDTWESIDTGIGRRYPTAVLLPDDTVLVINGEEPRGSNGDPRAPQVINPSTGAVTIDRRWPDDDVRGYHNTALLLLDGRVLIGGGSGNEKTTPNNERTDVRYYSPRYLSTPSLRPQIIHAPREMFYGEPYAVRYANGPVHRATLIALGASTHSFDQNQRFIELFNGESAVDKLVLRGPADAFVAPPGDYMLFLGKRVAETSMPVEVPSVAHVVRVV